MKKFLIAVGLMVSSASFAEIREIRQMSEINDHLSQPIGEEDWVLFDIDNTLTKTDHPALYKSSLYLHKDRFKKELARYSEEEKEVLPIFMITHAPSILVEKDLPSFIQKLRQSGATVLGFTAADTSVISGVGEIPAWRYGELKRLGIFFSAELEWMAKRHEFSHFPSFRGTFPVYTQGILYANANCSKGEVFNALLDRIERAPKRVIFIDDTLGHVQDLDREMAKRGIPFQGFHYVPETSHVPVAEADWNRVWQEVHDRVKKENFSTGLLTSGHPASIRWAIEAAPEDSLILFDVANVLLKRKDNLLKGKTRNGWVENWFKNQQIPLDEAYWGELFTILDREGERILTHDAMRGLVEMAKGRAKAMAFTRHAMGETGDGTTFQKRRLEQLRKCGIDFGDPFTSLSNWASGPHQATYSNGILQTGAPLKGPVLQAFLKDLQWTPRYILFVDDRREQCESVALAAKELGIPSLCIHYTQATDEVFAIDPLIADLQLRTLHEERRWLSDREAREVLCEKQ